MITHREQRRRSQWKTQRTGPGPATFVSLHRMATAPLRRPHRSPEPSTEGLCRAVQSTAGISRIGNTDCRYCGTERPKPVYGKNVQASVALHCVCRASRGRFQISRIRLEATRHLARTIDSAPKAVPLPLDHHSPVRRLAVAAAARNQPLRRVALRSREQSSALSRSLANDAVIPDVDGAFVPCSLTLPHARRRLLPASRRWQTPPKTASESLSDGTIAEPPQGQPTWHSRSC